MSATATPTGPTDTNGPTGPTDPSDTNGPTGPTEGSRRA